jgi:hypothetical protein
MAFVAARLDPDVMGRVGEEEVDGHAVEEPVEVGLGARIPAEEPMLAQDPEVTCLGHRLVRRLGDVVGIGQTGRGFRWREAGEHRRKCLRVDSDLGEELAQIRLVGRGHRRERVEASEDQRLLLG